MKKDLISIIVPVYNIDKYIEKCLLSLVKQSYKNIEIVVVNDGSVDKSEEICKFYARQYSKVKLYTKENGGLSDARNYGISKSHGEYIVFVDGDDYVDEKMCEILINSLKENNADISICGRIIENKGRKSRPFYSNKNELYSKNEALMELNSLRKFDMSAWAKLYKISLFNDIKFPIGVINEDLYIMYRIFNKCNRIVYNESKLYYYVQRIGSISKRNNIDEYYINAAKEQYTFFIEKNPEIISGAITMLSLAYMFQYNRYLQNKVYCPKNMLVDYKKYVANNLSIVIKNKYLPLIRKIQLFTFAYFNNIYTTIIKTKQLMRKNSYYN